MGHAEVAAQVLFGVRALLVADDRDRAIGPAQARDPADDRRIIAEGAVAVQLDEIGAEVADVVEGVRAVGLPGELYPCPGVEGGALGLARRAHERHLQHLGLDGRATVTVVTVCDEPT